MKQGARFVAVIAVATLAAGGGYWLGLRNDGGHGPAPAAQLEAGETLGQRQPLYYRHPMGLPDTSPVPKKDPMGMAYIPVFDGGQDEAPGDARLITINTEKVQKLGVRTVVAGVRSVDRRVRASGRVEPDERRTYAISPKFEGYVERLHVNTTGQPVARGQPLFEVYSPELVSVQREYAIAIQGVQALENAGGEARSAMQQLAESSLMRLTNWDISAEQRKTLAESGEIKRTLSFRSPVTGIVTEKKALQGMRFMPGEMLYQVADLSTVWVIADVFEQDIGLIASGARATVRINAYPDKVFEGAVTYVYPTLDAATRTVPVRLELSNPGQRLKPGMFAQVELVVPATGPAVAVPVSAVIDSGTRQIVLIQHDQGRFEPREVKLGSRSDDYVEVIEGLKGGEPVVVAANFLLDAESNLKAAIGGFGHAAHGGAPATVKEAEQGSPATNGPGHQAEGTVDATDVQAGTVRLRHGPVESLAWPAMTMDYKVANGTLLKDLKVGARIAVEFVERQPGEWVITSVKSLAASTRSGAPVSGGSPHADH